MKKTAIPSIFPWNKASQEQKQQSSAIQNSLHFDSTKVQATYARIRPIAFAEEQSFMDTAASDLLEDPLQSCDHESVSFLSEINSADDNIIECEFGNASNDTEEFPQKGQLRVAEHLHGKSVQDSNVKNGNVFV